MSGGLKPTLPLTRHPKVPAPVGVPDAEAEPGITSNPIPDKATPTARIRFNRIISAPIRVCPSFSSIQCALPTPKCHGCHRSSPVALGTVLRRTGLWIRVHGPSGRRSDG